LQAAQLPTAAARSTLAFKNTNAIVALQKTQQGGKREYCTCLLKESVSQPTMEQAIAFFKACK